MKPRYLFIGFILLVCSNTSAQLGYLGNTVGVEFKTRVVPNMMVTQSIKNKTVSKVKFQLFRANYSINLHYVVSSSFVISLGYEFGHTTMSNHDSYFIQKDSIYETDGGLSIKETAWNYVKDPAINIHRGNIDFRYYRSGNLAPTGKYFGIGMSFSEATAIQSFVLGKRSAPLKHGLFQTTYDLIDIDTVQISPMRLTELQLNAKVGRSLPLTKNLILNYGMTVPIITLFSIGSYSTTARNINYYPGAGIYSRLMHSARKLNYFTLDVGINFFF